MRCDEFQSLPLTLTHSGRFWDAWYADAANILSDAKRVFRLGTQVQGWEKRALSDTLVSAQLWIIYPVGGSSSAYFIRNAGTRTTFMELTDGKFPVRYRMTAS